jgi:hypothetical protein
VSRRIRSQRNLVSRFEVYSFISSKPKEFVVPHQRAVADARSNHIGRSVYFIQRCRYFAEGYLSDSATSRRLSMPYAFAAYDLNHGHANDKPIELKRPPLKIFIIELYLDWDGQFVTAVDLCPASQSRGELVNASLGPECHEIVLIEQRRAGSDKIQVAHKNAEQLRQFIETRPAKEAPDRGQIS